MPQVTVNIAERTYRISCADGEERHLENLASFYDTKIGEMRQAFGEIGDMRLMVMAAIAISDELGEAKRRIEALEGETKQVAESAAAGDERVGDIEARMAEGIGRISDRLERLARVLGTSGGG
jgi:cell division protein ZapA